MRNVDLSSILNDYIDWVTRVGPYTGRSNAKPGAVSLPRLGQDPPDVTQVTDDARGFLASRLLADRTANFALSIIEPIAYTASRFASADHANAHLYRAWARRILETGLPLESDPQRE